MKSRFIFRASAMGIMLAAAVSLSAAAFLPGCGNKGPDQAKQRFADGIIGIIRENQSQPEIAEEGQQAFAAYYQSGFSDLESAARAAQSFEESNRKDAGSLTELEALEKPDQKAESIASGMAGGIRLMDEGNSLYAEELRKAPGQSQEERANINEAGKSIMEIYYLEGLDAIIAALNDLAGYIKANKLNGADEVQGWLERFRGERKDIEYSLRFM